MRLHIEIRPGEGGDDARLLVKEQASIYIKHAERHGIQARVIQDQPATLGWLSLTLELEGSEQALSIYRHESGGHRWQRTPPTERHGRIHTSTVTVAVMDIVDPVDFRLMESDIDVRTQRGSGPGGQHRNTTDSCVVMKHRPTGIESRADLRSQFASRRAAREMLEARVAAHYRSALHDGRNSERRALTGCGERGDKIRTYRVSDDRVSDVRSGRKVSLRKLLAGNLDILN